MEKTKICPICGTEFALDAPRQKYCSISCSRAGAAAMRSKWIQRSGHREKDRLRHRERRAQARQERAKRSQESQERGRTRIASCIKQNHEDFIRRCEAGDLHALMLREKADGGNISKRYWELFAETELSSADSSGIISDTIVNGYSIYNDHFADDVVKSIREEGHIIIKHVRRK